MLRFGRVLILTAGLPAAFGCGARTDAFAFPDAGNATGAAVGAGGTPGGAGSGGAQQAGGRVGTGGHVGTGGFIGTGGFVGTGGSIACGPCPLIGCGSGQQLTTLQGECCPSCEQCNAKCAPPPLCPPGEQSLVPPGQCCPSCVLCGGECVTMRCGPGAVATTLPGQCCPVCVMSDPCAGVKCGNTSCPAGTAPVTLPGTCCPKCTPIVVDASPGPCNPAGFSAYLDKQIAATDALSCTVDSDCAVAQLTATCGAGCPTVVNAKFVMLFDSGAQEFASMYCTGCSPGISCAPRRPSCMNGQCTGITLPLGK